LFTNLISSDPKNGEIYNGMIRVIDGEKVGFFGLTTEETKDISSPGKVEFEDYIEEAKKAVKGVEVARERRTNTSRKIACRKGRTK
jgi:5'-nucleotidase/UDP-sugar diphosphatase